MNRPKLSALIITLNEEKNIRRCLESIKDVVDEIVIVDACSSDKTVEIAKEYTDKIYQKRLGYGESRKLAFEKCTGEWILSIDADEALPPELAKEIREVIKNTKYDAFKISDKLLFLGRWVNYSITKSPDVKLFRKDKAILVNRNVGEHFETTGRVGKLKNKYLHYQNHTVSERVRKIDKYTTLAVKDRIKEGRHFRLFNLFYRPIRYFFWELFCYKTIKGGIPGLFQAILKSYSVMIEEMKMYETEVMKNESI